MSATNATTNYSLPLFIGTDKPAWLVDWNTAMTDIDGQMKTNATGIQANATSISGLSTTVSAHTTSISTISGEISTLTTGLNSAQGAINTIQSLIGNGEPTTTDKTLIGAINEIYGMITGGANEIEAENVAYDNTESGLTATDVQAAIDEVKAEVDDISTGLHYSSTERVCGTWINGKPLYEKVISSTFPTVTTNGTFETKNVPHGIVNGDVIFAPESFLTTSDSPRPLPALTNSNHSAKFAIDATYVTLVSDATAFSEAAVVVVLRYTKTTD